MELQLKLLNSSEEALSLSAWLRNYLTESRDLGISWHNRAAVIKQKLFYIKEHLRLNYGKELYPDRSEEKWFPAYVSLWELISQVYADANIYVKYGRRMPVTPKKKIETGITMSLKMALDEFDKFLTKDF